MNVITKSGTNTIHGSLFEYFRDESLTAAASDDTPLTGFRRNQFGGTLGGPIKKDKLFFFVASEGIMEDLTRANLSTPLGRLPASLIPLLTQETITRCRDFRQPGLPAPDIAELFPSQISAKRRLAVDHIQRNASVFGRADLLEPRRQESVVLFFQLRPF